MGMDHQMTRQLEQDTLAFERERNPALKIDRQIERGLQYYNGLLGVAPQLRQMLAQLLTEDAILEHSDTTSETGKWEMVAQWLGRLLLF